MGNNKMSIIAHGLEKRFGDVQAVLGVDFEVRQGELFGFLGPNGAGKTTTINMLTGLARPDAGSIYVGGINCTKQPKAAQQLIGVVPDESNLYPEMTGFENLCFCAALYGLNKTERQERANKLLDQFNLTQASNRKFGGYSKGMKRKLTIAAGIIHQPQILFLDEPTAGIDVASARQLRQLIANLHLGGTTIFLTTHYIEEAERLCERIAFILSGRIVCIDTVEHLTQSILGKHVLQIVCTTIPDRITIELAECFPEFLFMTEKQGLIRVESDNPVSVGPIIRFLEDRGVIVSEAKRIRPSLEDVFVQITGLEAEVMRKEKEKIGGGQ